MPDPELLAHVEQCRAEMDAMKKQLSLLKNDKTDLSSERSRLQAQVAEQAAVITQLQAALDASRQGVCVIMTV